MGCGVEEVCPANLAVSEDWDIVDPLDKPVEEVRRIRKEINTKVTDLLWEIQKMGNLKGG
jgi:hypothetical protein